MNRLKKCLYNKFIQLIYSCPTSGPFNVKEHVCITVAASTGGVSAYATVRSIIELILFIYTVYGTSY